MMKLNVMRDMDVILSRGGPEVIEATFRRARLSDPDSMYELSLPFMESGALLVRDHELFVAQIEDFYVV